MPAEVPGTRPVSKGNKQTRKHNVDSPLEAHDPSSLRALEGGGRVPSVAVRRPRLRSVALYVTAGGQCTLSTPLQLSVSSAKCSFLMDTVRTNGGGAMPVAPTPSPFTVLAEMRLLMGASSPVNRSPNLIVVAKDLLCSLRIYCTERGKLLKGFAHL